MTQYNTLNVKLSNLELDKLKSGIKSRPEVTLKFSSNNSLANTKSSKTQLYK